MGSSSGDHGRRGMKQPLLHPWPPTPTTPAPGHNFSLSAAAAGGCFPWPPSSPPPPSSYTCGYCRREFRSAQALGGHMNVHRRDRARLRQCCSAAASASAAHQHIVRAPPPPPPPLRRLPIPNLNFSPPQHCAAAAAADPVVYSFFSTTTTTATMATAAADGGVVMGNKAAGCFEVSLELGIGVCGSGHGGAGHGGSVVVEDDGVDLELRLGCAWE